MGEWSVPSKVLLVTLDRKRFTRWSFRVVVLSDVYIYIVENAGGLAVQFGYPTGGFLPRANLHLCEGLLGYLGLLRLAVILPWCRSRHHCCTANTTGTQEHLPTEDI